MPQVVMTGTPAMMCCCAGLFWYSPVQQMRRTRVACSPQEIVAAEILGRKGLLALLACRIQVVFLPAQLSEEETGAQARSVVPEPSGAHAPINSCINFLYQDTLIS
jgi:hypothetical protein